MSTRQRPVPVAIGAIKLITLMAAICWGVACSGSGTGGDGGNGDGASGDGGLLGTPTSLEVTPAMSTVNVPAGGNTTVVLQAIAHYASGQTQDVTRLALWRTNAANVSIALGNVRISTAGVITVTASVPSAAGMATITASTAGNLLADGNTPMNAPMQFSQPLDSATPTVAYPLDHSVFPANLGACEFQIQTTDPSQTLARIHFTGMFIDVSLYGTCNQITSAPNGSTVPNSCGITLPLSLVPALAGASEHDLTTQVDLAATDGSHHVQSATMTVWWTNVTVSGGLYYWTTVGSNDTTAIAQFNLDAPAAPIPFYQQSETPMQQCMGCHAISPDGTTMAVTLGGGGPANYQLLNVSTKTVIGAMDSFADFTTFSPDGQYVLNSYNGQLLLRTASAALTTAATLFQAGLMDPALSHPFWSPTGSGIAFDGYDPCANTDGGGGDNTGQLVHGSQIYVSDTMGDMTFATPRILVPRMDTASSFYPAISDDGQYVIFDQSQCAGGPEPACGYGADPCDGYNDPTARLQLVQYSGGTPQDLGNMNDTPPWTNSWPRWAPHHGVFQGNNLYWVAFSSRRPYGLRLPGSNDTSTKPQLWLGAIQFGQEVGIAGDPSFAPIWMPLQDTDMNAPTGNHIPQWVGTAVQVMPPG